MTFDDKDQLSDMVATHGLQDVLETLAEIANERGARDAENRDWGRCSRKLHDLAATPAVENVS